MKKLGILTVVFFLMSAAIVSGTEDTSNPILTWNTFMGAGGDESAEAVTLDPIGNIYIVGWSSATWGSPIRAYTGNYDAFVAKLSPDGTLLWNTFLGGTQMDGGLDIGLDGSGNIYVSGYSNAAWGSPVRAFVVAQDQFLAKLDSSGNLVWNTFLGGTANDYNNGLTVDSSGNSYVVGASLATWGSPVNPMVVSPAGFRDWSIAKVNSSGALQWNTFHGGTNHDNAFAAVLDALGGLYVVGECRTTWGSPLLPYSGGADITIVKLNVSNGVRAWHTFFGQAGGDYAYDIDLSPDDSLFIAGRSDATWGTPINPHSGSMDGVVVAIELDGTMLGNTFLGGTGNDDCSAVAHSRSGGVYVGGTSASAWGSPDRPYGGGASDGFVVRLGSGGILQGLDFLGGSGIDGVNGLARDANRNFYAVGTSETNWGSPIVTFGGLYDGFLQKSTFLPEALTRHAIGDFDGDARDEAAVDFGDMGTWMYDGGVWSQLSGEDVEALATLDIDGSGDDEIVVDSGDGGLLLWDSGSVSQLSSSDVEGLAVGDLDASGDEEVLADLGAAGLWIYDLGYWTQLSAANADYMTFAQLGGSHAEEIVADFGATGLWVRQGSAWFQASGVNADFFVCGDTDGNGTSEIVGDFGPTGLWLWNGGAWTQLSGANVNYLIMADTNADNKADIIGDFGPVGLWLWSNGSWTMLSGVREDWMIAANVDASPAKEVFVDFGPLGLWAYAAGGWYQLSGVNPDYIMSGDFDGDTQAELMADFGTLGLWVCDNGAWTQVSGINPD
jgi:hypothetical protein